MTRFTTISAISFAAGDPVRLGWAQGLMNLFGVAVIALFLGWLLARWFRLRYVQVSTGGHSDTDSTDAWIESGRRMMIDDDTVDLDPPPEHPRNPDSRWQT